MEDVSNPGPTSMCAARPHAGAGASVHVLNHTATPTQHSTPTLANNRKLATTPKKNPQTPQATAISVLQLNINSITNKQDELKQPVYTTRPGIITIQETEPTTTSKTPKITNYTPIRTDRVVVKLGGGLLTYIRHNITLIHLYIPPRDTSSPHYAKLDPDITYCIGHITNITDSILTCDMNARSTLPTLALIH